MRLMAVTAVIVGSQAAFGLASRPALAWEAGGNTTTYGPSVTNCASPFNNQDLDAWIAFTGTDGQINLLEYPFNTSINSSGQDNIIAQYELGVYAVGAPTLTCSVQNLLVLGWRNSANRLEFAYLVNSGGTIVPSELTTWPETTDASPSLASTKDLDQSNYMVVAWAGTDSSHHINLAFVNSNLAEGAKFTTTDYTRANAGVGVGEQVQWPGSGLTWLVGFIAASGNPNIYVGFFPANGTTNLNSVRTTDSSAYAPGLYQNELLWKGYANNLIYQGVFNGSNNLNSSAPFTDTTFQTPALNDCATAYEGTDYHIYYNTEPFFGC